MTKNRPDLTSNKGVMSISVGSRDLERLTIQIAKWQSKCSNGLLGYPTVLELNYSGPIWKLVELPLQLAQNSLNSTTEFRVTKVSIGQGDEGKIQDRRLRSHLQMPKWSRKTTIPIRNERVLKYLSDDQKLTQTDIKWGSYEQLHWIARFTKINNPNCKMTIEDFQWPFWISNCLRIRQLWSHLEACRVTIPMSSK